MATGGGANEEDEESQQQQTELEKKEIVFEFDPKTSTLQPRDKDIATNSKNHEVKNLYFLSYIKK